MALTLVASSASAQAAAPPRPPQTAPPGAPADSAPAPNPPPSPAPAPLDASDKRPTPDYDGRPEQPDDGENVGTWTLRVLFFPAYVVSEYVLRRPLGWITVEAERINLVNSLVDFFTFGPDRNAGIFPTALLDFGFKPSVGLFFFWDDAFAEGNSLRVNAATWGPRWLRLSVADRYEFAPGARIGLQAQGWNRPDWVFYGLGPSSSSDDEGRYERRDLSAGLRLDVELPRTSYFSAYSGIHGTRFEDESCCDDDAIGELVDEGAYALPPGFEEGYALYRHGFELALDTRRPRPDPSSGVRLVVRAEQNARLSGDAPDQWVRYGGTLGAFVDVTGKERTVGISVSAAFADPVGEDAEIPFTEQIVLGGNAPLRGFLEGRLIDRSALVGKLEYTWPVWALFDGSLAMEAGNVFGEHLSNFDAELARLSVAFGFRAHGRRDQPFEAMIGVGTEPIADGAEIESLRIVFGAHHGF